MFDTGKRVNLVKLRFLALPEMRNFRVVRFADFAEGKTDTRH
jgi:hypothetical protein